jgi:NADH:ubiquinone reductase (non-electrogenic)
MSLPRLVILGTGFGAFSLVKHLRSSYAVTIVSPRNHFLFTPLLPSTTVGTLEFRSIIEPIRHTRKNLDFFHAVAKGLDITQQVVQCEGIGDGHGFTVGYDVLVLAIGAASNTFNVPGVLEHALFLRELNDARVLRQRIITNFERANLPGVPVEERQRLLHFVICGGGPTGVEFAAELNDFMVEDLHHSYPALVAEARISLVEAGKEILSTFDEKLRKYATDLFRRERISVLTESPVNKVDEQKVFLDNGSELAYGLLVWSTGIGPTPFAKAVDLPKDRRSRILVDRHFRVKGYDNIYALGDCGAVDGEELPATSQVAQQQGKYLSKALVRRASKKTVPPFQYHHLGMLAYVGSNRALADLQNFKGRGWYTWLFWRSAYLSRIVSLRNKVLVLFDWMKTQMFGRDISQF